jgi:hypothetical protein
VSTDNTDEQREIARLKLEVEKLQYQVAMVEGWRQGALLVVRQLERRLKEAPLSLHPGCGYCMSVGTPVQPGEICPLCFDRSPER